MMILNSKDLELTILMDQASFKVKSNLFPGTSLRSQINVTCKFDSKTIQIFRNPCTIKKFEENQHIPLQFSTLKSAKFVMATEIPGLEAIIRFGLDSGEAMALIQIELNNQTGRDLVVENLTPLMIEAGDLHLNNPDHPEPFFYSNGWQSWSATGAYGFGEKQRQSILGPFQNPMVINPGTPKPKDRNHFSGDMFGVLGDHTSRVGLLAGFLSQSTNFGSLEAQFNPEPSLKMWANGDSTVLPVGGKVQTDWAVVSFVDLNAPEPMAGYFTAVARENNIDSSGTVPVGWCSWYHFYEDITEADIEKNLNAVQNLKSELPLSLLQIDDGFETYPGDWFDFDPEFPNGLQPLVHKIKDAGLTPGIWLAPYIVHRKSNLVKDHPDWLLRNEKGKPVNAGFVWNGFTYALDLTNPEAFAYTCDVIRTAVKTWGFKYLKLDFLYAAALAGVYQDRTQTRAQVLRRGLEAIRQAAGNDVTLLACGCPLGSALGLFDAMRISADVSGHWRPHFPPVSPLLQKEPHMPAASTALQNIITRAPLHRHWWINDPDCLLVRPDTDLTLAEVETLATAIGLTGGSLLLSDDLPALPEERLRIAQVLLPIMDERAQVPDLFDATTPSRLRLDLHGALGDWHLLAGFNWEDQPAEMHISPKDFHLPDNETWWFRDFWRGDIGQISPTSPLIFENVPPHGVRLLAIRSYDASQATYLGSNLHLSQGKEVKIWCVQQDELRFSLDLGHEFNGEVSLYLPKPPLGASINGLSQTLHSCGDGIYSLVLDIIDGKEIKIIF